MSGGIIRIEIPGAPVAKGRAKLSTQGGFARAYTPAKTRHYEDLIRLAAGQEMNGRPPMEGPLSVAVQAFVAMPKAFGAKKRAAAEAGKIKPTTRPDADNYVKAALDGLNLIAFRDDAQIVELLAWKHYSERPRLVVTVREMV